VLRSMITSSPLSIRLSTFENQLLVQAADRTGKTKTELIREAVRRVVKNELDVARDDALEKRLTDAIRAVAAEVATEQRQIRGEIVQLRKQLAPIAEWLRLLINDAAARPQTNQPERGMRR